MRSAASATRRAPLMWRCFFFRRRSPMRSAASATRAAADAAFPLLLSQKKPDAQHRKLDARRR